MRRNEERPDVFVFNLAGMVEKAIEAATLQPPNAEGVSCGCVDFVADATCKLGAWHLHFEAERCESVQRLA